MELNELFKKTLIGAKVVDITMNKYGSVEITLKKGRFESFTLNYFHSEADADPYLIKDNREIGV